MATATNTSGSGMVFRNEDLRSKKFTGTNLRGAVFENCIFGINSSNRFIIFMISACLSLFAGYIAMLSGNVTQSLLTSDEQRLRLAGYAISGLFVVFIAVVLWSGLNYRSAKVAIGMIVLIIIVGAVAYFTDASATGIGTVYGVGALLLVIAMLIIGTVARATAGSLQSTVLFIIVAMGGGMFAKSLGGGVGTLIMALATAVISKKALKSDQDSLVKNLALRISTSFGTSFKNADLTGASFKDVEVKNCDFNRARLSNITLDNVKESLCYYGRSGATLTGRNFNNDY